MKKIVFLFFLAVSFSFSKEDYLTKVEFFTKLSAFFSYSQLESMYNKIPDDIQVWGYDVGDYSGDSLEDCAFSFRMMKDTKRNMTVMFFINRKDSFMLADNYDLQFSVLPIEIGFNIQNSECNVTHKLDEEYWEIKSYSVVNGNIKLIGYYESKNETTIEFLHNGATIKLFPYTGWHTGKTIKDGRGVRNLLKQLKKEL